MDRHTPTPPYCSGGCGVSGLETENHKIIYGLSGTEVISSIVSKLGMQKLAISKRFNILYFHE